MRPIKIKIYKNQRFGKLVFIGERKLKKIKRQNISIYKCKCDCGKTLWAFSGNLTRGRTKSCGCEVGFKPRLHRYKGEILTLKQIAKKKKMRVESLYERIKKNKSLINRKYYYQHTKNKNSMASLGRKVKLSREWIRQLMKKQGLSKEEILLKYL